MSLFKITSETGTTTTENTLNVDLSMALINKYATSDTLPDIGAWKHELFLSKEKIKNGINDLEQIKNSITLIMNGQALVVREVSHIDSETGEKVIDTPAEYNTIPTDVTYLRQLLFDLVKMDYSIKKTGDYNFTDAELRNLTDYVANMFIKYSDGSGSASFSTFRSLITM